MIVIYIILGVLLAVLIWLLVIPVQLIVDSDKRRFMVRILTIGYAAILIKDSVPVFGFRIFFFSKEIPFHKMVKSSGKERKLGEKSKKEKKKRRFKLTRRKRRWIMRFTRIPGSFRIKKILMDIDSGDYIINGYMFPVFSWLNNYRPGWSWNVNYFGRIQVYLILQSSLIRMLYIVLKISKNICIC